MVSGRGTLRDTDSDALAVAPRQLDKFVAFAKTRHA